MRNILVLGGILALLWGCAHTERIKVTLPPNVDLTAYNHVGVITFASNADDNLKHYLTQHFLQEVQAVQPGVRFLELGSQEPLLSGVHRASLDLEAIKALGEKYQVDAILYGHLNISGMKPDVQLSSWLTSMRAQAYVTGALNTKLWETGSGATIWTNASTRKTSVAGLSLSKTGPVNLGISDPKEKYGQLIQDLVHDNTQDFRPRYLYKKVRKEK